MKKLGFGLMRLPKLPSGGDGDIDIPQVCRMADIFIERGFTYFDTAYMYHDFKSEIAAREAVVKRHARDTFTLASKLPTMFLKKAEDMERIFNEQLEKCGVEFFDYYLLHHLSAAHYQIAEKLGAFDFISRKKAEGKIKHIGFSYHDNAELLDKILCKHPEVEFVQLQINYLDWNSESIQSRLCYETARRHGKPIVVMEPIKGGNLASLPPKAEKILRDYDPDMSPASWAIRFAASHDGILTVLSGMSSIEQLLDNTSLMSDFKPMNDEEFKLVEKVAKEICSVTAVPCTACNYCTSACPKHIAIPKYFSLYNVEKISKNDDFSIQRIYYENYSKSYGKASDCINCRRCVQRCPQHISIPEELKKVAEVFEK